MREDKNEKGSGKRNGGRSEDIKLDDLLDNTLSEEEQQAKARQRRKRRLEDEGREDRVKQARSKEVARNQQKAKAAAMYRLERDIKGVKTLEEANRINLSQYTLEPKKKRKYQDELDKLKSKLEVEKYERELEEEKRKQAPVRAANMALPVFLQPLANAMMNMRLKDKEKNLKKAKKKRRKVFLNVTGIMAAASGFLFLTLLLLVIAAGSITSILLSHPEAIRELYENNLLGDAMYMGNVTEDVVVDGKVIVKGNPASRPGCFIYNGVWYCGNCKVVNEGQSNTDCQAGTPNYDKAGQGPLTVEATEWAKKYEVTFIGDSLGVGVQPELVKYMPKVNYDVLSSRWLIYQSADSTDPLNGLQALRTLKEDNNIKEVLVVALGTNGGLKQEDLQTFIKEVPDSVQQIIFINSGSKGGTGDYGTIDTDEISKQIKEAAKTNQKVGYLDWLTYTEKEGWDKLTSDSVHLNTEGNKAYATFITQGLYDIIVGGESNTCAVGNLGSHNISDNKDDSKLREGVTVSQSEGIQDWPRKVMHMGTNIFTDVKDISGFRPGDSGDHGKGLAIDFMVPVGSHDSNTDLGDVIAQWLVDNRMALNINYIIWEQRIYMASEGSWKDMEDRGSVTENHFDHPHVSFHTGNGDVSKVTLPTKGEIELGTVSDGRGGVTEGLDDLAPPLEESQPGLGKATVDTEHLGDSDITGTHDLYNMTEVEYQEYLINKKVEEDLIVARGSKKPGKADTTGWESKKEALYNFNVRSKEPEWVDVDFLKELFSEHYPNSRMKGKEQELLDLSDKYGINVAVMLGQYYLETSMGTVGCPAGAPHNPANYESPYNFGCVMWPGTSNAGAGKKQSDFDTNWMVDLGVKMNENGYVASRYWADPQTPELGMELGFRVYDNLAKSTNTYKEVLDLYSPIGDGGQNHDKFMKAMYGVLQQFHIDINTDYGQKTPGSGARATTNNPQDPDTFYCPENCVITEQEKALGTGNIKAIQKGKIWQNDNILLTDLGYTADTVTPQAIDEFINTVAPNDNGIKGMGAVFYEAGQKSGYDPRYILAHMIHETNWGRSTIWLDKNNAYGWMAYDDTPYDSAKDFETKEKGIIEGAQMIYKNYYVDHSQKNLKDMHRDPDTTRNHNYATDPEWHTKIGAIMLSMEKTMGPSTGGSVVQGSNNGQQATTPTGLNLGRSCLINDVSFNNLPYPPEQMSISSFYHDDNYGYGSTHGGADMTYTHGGSGPIYSVDAGEVTDVMTNCSVGNSDCGGGWGNYIKIKHTGVADGQYETQYAHLESGSIKVKMGDTVTAGQEIGTMGTTGRSTGIHLHFELWHNGVRVDNYPYFSWKDATYEPGWDNYKGPHTGELCVPGATQKGQQSSDNRSQTCDITDGSTKVPSSGLIGSDNPEKVYNFFKGHGFSDAAIAGILGNLKQESDVQSRLVQGIYDKSTYTMSDEELDKIMKRSIVIWSDPNMPGEGIGPAMGVSQWEHTAFYNGALQPGRWENLMAWAKKNGYSHWDLEAQLEYIIREMGIVKDPDVPLEYGTSLINNGGPWSRGFVGITGMENFQKATDITKATYTYFQYNRAGSPHMDNRIAYAKEFYAQMGNWS